jgi:hypothetical protein
MAKIIGELGRTSAGEAINKLRRNFLISASAISVLALITGFTLCLALQPRGLTFFVLVAEIALLGVAAFLIDRRITRAINAQEQERLEWRKNALSKATVGFVLEALTDGYIIFNDLSTLSSRIDHIVIGPPGIFMIETKNWRGTIRPDGQGELLCNGKSTGQCEVKNLLTSIASLREKINILTHRDDFIQGILAFPLARVEAHWGTSRNVHCLTDDRLLEYIEQYRFARRLKKEEIDLVEKAIQALVGMESSFDPADGGLTILPIPK